jgi:hypothetical protein
MLSTSSLENMSASFRVLVAAAAAVRALARFAETKDTEAKPADRPTATAAPFAAAERAR